MNLAGPRQHPAVTMLMPRCFQAMKPHLERDLSVSNVLEIAMCVTRATEISTVFVTSPKCLRVLSVLFLISYVSTTK